MDWTIIISAIAATALFIYLFAALLFPEDFS